MNALAQKLQARIRNTGSVTFRDFMQSALYDPAEGYYNTQPPKIGPAGDYYTSSNVHAAFGASLAGLFTELLSGLEGDPSKANTAESPPADDGCTILEIGAGTGQLAHDILTALRIEHPQMYARVKYLIVERSPAMDATQRQKLAEYLDKVEWRALTADGHPNVDSINGIIFSNEVVDALPVHVIRVAPDGLEELYVTCGNAPGSAAPPLPSNERLAGSESTSSPSQSAPEFRFSWGNLSSGRIKQYIDRMDVDLPEGQVVEVNLDAVDWLRAITGVLSTGYLVTIDYGDIAGHLYGQDRRRGTLRAFYKHAIAPSVLERVGEQDITASVNFTALMEYGRDAGLETISFERQSAFLVRMGLIDRIAAMAIQPEEALADLKDRLAIKNLFVPGGASDNFRVLIQRKGRL